MTVHPALNVLVVDDNRSAAEAAALLLGRDGHRVEVVHDGRAAIERLHQQPFDLVLTDLRMEPVDGLSVVRAARACDPPVDAIVFTAYGSVEKAVEAMRLGAVDFLTKPITADQLLRRVREFRSAPQGGLALVGESDAMRTLREQAVKLAQVRSTVLVVGETGSGRRHLTRWLHQNGPDADLPMLVAHPGRDLDPGQLRGAGTLLLPSVDDLTAGAQVQLLRQLEGLDAGQPPRVIATASPEIEGLVATGALAPELYFRLAVLVVRVAPLRERLADIAPLLEHFVAGHSRAFGKEGPRPTPEQLANLQRHGWTGNVRELANLAERAVVMGPGAYDQRPVARREEPVAGRLEPGFNLSEHLEAVERTLLSRAIDETGGDRTAMSRLLGLERNTLRYKLNKYDLLKRT